MPEKRIRLRKSGIGIVIGDLMCRNQVGISYKLESPAVTKGVRFHFLLLSPQVLYNVRVKVRFFYGYWKEKLYVKQKILR